MSASNWRSLPLFLLAVGFVLEVACKHDGDADRPGKAALAEEQVASGVHFVTLFPAGADESSPLIVGIHGRGGGPRHFGRVWKDFPDKVEIAMPQGFQPFGEGWQWFDWPPELSDGELADRVAAAEAKLWPAIVEIAHGRKVIVTGFSQGAVLSYVLAARHPDAIAYAFPMSGGAPHKLLPHDHARAAPVYAMHGTADQTLSIDYGRAAVAAFQREGDAAELREYPGVGHTMTPEMRDDLWTHVRAIAQAQRSDASR